MFENKKILVLGMARSGYEVCKYLSKHNNTIILNDGGSRDRQDDMKVKELENKNSILKVSGSLNRNPGRQESQKARAFIDGMVKEIDRCLRLLDQQE